MMGLGKVSILVMYESLIPGAPMGKLGRVIEARHLFLGEGNGWLMRGGALMQGPGGVNVVLGILWPLER